MDGKREQKGGVRFGMGVGHPGLRKIIEGGRRKLAMGFPIGLLVGPGISSSAGLRKRATWGGRQPILRTVA